MDRRGAAARGHTAVQQQRGPTEDPGLLSGESSSLRAWVGQSCSLSATEMRTTRTPRCQSADCCTPPKAQWNQEGKPPPSLSSSCCLSSAVYWQRLTWPKGNVYGALLQHHKAGDGQTGLYTDSEMRDKWITSLWLLGSQIHPLRTFELA